MEVFRYVTKEEDIRNLEGNKKTFRDLIGKIKNPKETVVEIDYSNIEDPQVSTSAAIIFQKILDGGFPKIIILSHKNQQEFMKNSLVKLLINEKQLEFK